MKVTLLKNEWKEDGDPIKHILLNRGLKPIDIQHYLHTTDEDINSPAAFGEEILERGAKMLISHVSAQDPTLIIVDADCDGFTSSALLINYLNDIFPTFVNNNVTWYLHSGKQHGLQDCVDIASKYKFIIAPDSSSNDFKEHAYLKSLGIDILVLDHHEADVKPLYYEDACIINNQLSPYPNKEFSGVGVTWQFCRYLDNLLNTNFANNYLDLVALGLTGDMMSMLSLETKHLIFTGFKEENIRNPFIAEIAKKNSFSLNKSDYKPSYFNDLEFTPIGAAFFIVPFVNAMVRSGTQEEKQLVFLSMLNKHAFKEIPSNKRGHKFGETERIVDQALRTCTNVKNRQTKAQDTGMELLEQKIQENNLLDHKALVFLLEPGEIDSNIAGLCANKIMSKYQRPVCVLTKKTEEDGRISYQGSARGCDIVGITHFKDICAEAPGCIFAAGHQGAFGLGLGYDYPDAAEVDGDWFYQFIDFVDEKLKDMPSESCYYVDYVWDLLTIDPSAILYIADMNDFIGKDVERPLVYIKGIKVNEDVFKVMKSNTLKYNLPNIDIIQFGGTEEEIEKFSTPQVITINAVCKCCINEWNYQRIPQLQMIDYEIVKNKNKSNMALAWGF